MSVTWYAIPAKKTFFRSRGSYCSNSLRSHALCTQSPNLDRAWKFLVINLRHAFSQAFISRTIQKYRLTAKQVSPGHLRSAGPASCLKHSNFSKFSVSAEFVATTSLCSSQNQLFYESDFIFKVGSL